MANEGVLLSASHGRVRVWVASHPDTEPTMKDSFENAYEGALPMLVEPFDSSDRRYYGFGMDGEERAHCCGEHGQEDSPPPPQRQ